MDISGNLKKLQIYWIRVLALSAVALVMLTGPSYAVPVTPKADFVFIVDATGSMAGEISAVKNGLSSFVTGLNAASVDFRFAVVLYGGGPEIVLDFTNNQAATIAAFNSISVNGAVSGFQGNHNVNPEAGLEAVRIVLNGANDNTLLRDNVGGSGPLAFRSDARKNLILVTDEDSDRPFYSANRDSGQTSTEPPSTINQAWQNEVDTTAQVVINNSAFINMLINAGDSPSKNQYGDPNQDSSGAGFLNFDPVQTLANLGTAGFGSSLQGQVLGAGTGLIGRTFDIGSVNTANFINNFFAAKIEEIVDNPLPGPGQVPEPATLAIFGLGLAGLGLMRRRRRTA